MVVEMNPRRAILALGSPLLLAGCTVQSDLEKICNAESRFLSAEERAHVRHEDQLTLAVPPAMNDGPSSFSWQEMRARPGFIEDEPLFPLVQWLPLEHTD